MHQTGTKSPALKGSGGAVVDDDDLLSGEINYIDSDLRPATQGPRLSGYVIDRWLMVQEWRP